MTVTNRNHSKSFLVQHDMERTRAACTPMVVTGLAPSYAAACDDKGRIESQVGGLLFSLPFAVWRSGRGGLLHVHLCLRLYRWTVTMVIKRTCFLSLNVNLVGVT